MNRWQRKLLTTVAVDEGLTDDALVKRGVATAVLVPSMRLLDWLLVGGAMGLFSVLRFNGFSDQSIWLIFWPLNLVVCGAVVIFNDRIKVDITLMQTVRKIVNALTRKTRMLGYLLETIVVARLLIWDGPDQLLIFFRERLRRGIVQIIFFISASGIQMYIWTKFYGYGYEGLTDIFKKLAMH